MVVHNLVRSRLLRVVRAELNWPVSLICELSKFPNVVALFLCFLVVVLFVEVFIRVIRSISDQVF